VVHSVDDRDDAMTDAVRREPPLEFALAVDADVDA
jgi:hypothetical protein